MEEKRHGGPLTYRRRKKKTLNELHDDVLIHTLKYFDAHDFVNLYKTNARLRHLIDDFPFLTALLEKHTTFVKNIKRIDNEDTRQKSEHFFAMLLELTFYDISIEIHDIQKYPYDPYTKDKDLLNALKEHAIKKYSEVKITTEFSVFIEKEEEGTKYYGALYGKRKVYMSKQSVYSIKDINGVPGSETFRSLRASLTPVNYFPEDRKIFVNEVIKGKFTELYEDLLKLMKRKMYMIRLSSSKKLELKDLYLKHVYTNRYKTRERFFDTFFNERNNPNVIKSQDIIKLYTTFRIFDDMPGPYLGIEQGTEQND
jgi:hypothetical protein